MHPSALFFVRLKDTKRLPAGMSQSDCRGTRRKRWKVKKDDDDIKNKRRRKEFSVFFSLKLFILNVSKLAQALPDEIGGSLCVIKLAWGIEKIILIERKLFGLACKLECLHSGSLCARNIHRAAEVADVIILYALFDIGDAFGHYYRHAERGGLCYRIRAALADIKIGCRDIFDYLVGKSECYQLHVLIRAALCKLCNIPVQTQ